MNPLEIDPGTIELDGRSVVAKTHKGMRAYLHNENPLEWWSTPHEFTDVAQARLMKERVEVTYALGSIPFFAAFS